MSWPEPRKAAMRVILDLWPDGEAMVIGAAALEALHRFRPTRDIDLVIDASPGDVDARLRSAGWTRDERVPHRWLAPTGDLVDVIPASAELLTAGRIVWPGGEVMRLTGLGLALRTAEQVEIGDERTIGVAALTVQPLLKMAAYLDRPAERSKDVGDVIALLRDGLARWDWAVEEAAAVQLDEDLACAYTLGRRLGRLTDAAESAIVEEFMRKARDMQDCDGTRELIVRSGRWIEEENDYEDPMPLFEAFYAGFERSIEEPRPA